MYVPIYPPPLIFLFFGVGGVKKKMKILWHILFYLGGRGAHVILFI